MVYSVKKRYRLLDYDYSSTGFYFVTICTKNKARHFGDIIKEKISLSNIGEMTKKYWLSIPDRFDNAILDEWVIMPNHIHGINIIMNDEKKNAPRRVPTGMRPLVKSSLSSIINHFKGNVKKWCNKNGFNYFTWQPRFYDHIIRNEKSLRTIQEYIVNNPLKWELDKNNPENIYM